MGQSPSNSHPETGRRQTMCEASVALAIDRSVSSKTVSGIKQLKTSKRIDSEDCTSCLLLVSLMEQAPDEVQWDVTNRREMSNQKAIGR